MIPTEGQAEALAMVDCLLAEDRAAFGVLTGFAGTGKTVTLKTLAEQHGDPLVLTPTGRAALRVREATGLQASTIHKWRYKVGEDAKTGEPRFMNKPIDELSLPANKLIVVDEASMVNQELWRDVWTLAKCTGMKVLLVGDPFQLPPVIKKEDGAWASFSCLTDLETEFRTALTEICRQALDSSIVRITMAIRKGEMQAMDAVLELKHVAERDVVEYFLGMQADSRFLLTHTNKLRQQLNLDIRKAIGHDPRYLVKGEPLLVLANNYGIDRMNGETVRFDGWNQVPDEPVAVRDRFKNTSAHMSFGLANIEGAEAILSQEEVFAQVEMTPTTVKRAATNHAIDYWKYEKLNCPAHLNANLGYALSVHKAQGSESQDVLVVAEPTIGGYGGLYSLEGRRWLYTAISRAQKNVAICFPART